MPAGKSTKSSTARRNEAYVDTSALIAFADRSDSHHSLFRRLFSDPPPLLTTPLVVGGGTWLVPEALRRGQRPSIPLDGRNDAAPYGLRWRTGAARRICAHSKVRSGRD